MRGEGGRGGLDFFWGLWLRWVSACPWYGVGVVLAYGVLISFVREKRSTAVSAAAAGFESSDFRLVRLLLIGKMNKWRSRASLDLAFFLFLDIKFPRVLLMRCVYSL